jgi:hypothetical protein
MEKMFKVNKPMTKKYYHQKMYSPHFLLQNVVEYKMLNHYDLFREQENVNSNQ